MANPTYTCRCGKVLTKAGPKAKTSCCYYCDMKGIFGTHHNSNKLQEKKKKSTARDLVKKLQDKDKVAPKSKKSHKKK